MKSVFINSKTGEITSTQEVPIHSILKLNASFVDMANHLQENELSVLIQFEHHQTTTILNLTEVYPFMF